MVLKSRAVTVSRFELVASPRVDGSFLDLDVVVDCSSGTYIRALARDLGSALGVGGHLTALRRTRIGPFRVESAHLVEQEISLLSNLEVLRLLMPEIEITAEQERDLRHGKRLDIAIEKTSCAVCLGRLVAVIEPAGSQAKSSIVFPEEA